MALLKRLSDSFWSYVSPSKTPASGRASKRRKLDQAAASAPPKLSKLVDRNDMAARRGSIQDIVRHSRSMSPSDRVDSWRVGSSSRATSSVVERSRKRKAFEMEYDDESMEYDSEGVDVADENEDVEDEEMGDYDEEEEAADGDQEDIDGYDEEDDGELEDQDEHRDGMQDVSEDVSNIRLRNSRSPSRSSSHKGYIYSDEDSDAPLGNDDSVFVSEAEYFAAPKRRKLTTLPEEHFSRGVSTEELRAAGWDDDHIVLVQKIAARGFEPLLPQYYKWDFRYMPDNLFEATDEGAFIGSVGAKQYRSVKALKKLFELGSRVRDRIAFNNDPRKTPEQDAIKHVQEYMKWAAQDASQLDPAAVIPTVALECKPADTDASVLQENIRRKMAGFYNRWRNAVRAQQSIESSPSTESTKLHYPPPQIYGIVASHTIIVLVAYRPDSDPALQPDIKAEELEDPDGQGSAVRNIAFFDMKDKDYDVWNALALAIVICHARNIQVRIGEETGVGMKGPDWQPPYQSDPDL